jgi:hypothetical protein
MQEEGVLYPVYLRGGTESWTRGIGPFLGNGNPTEILLKKWVPDADQAKGELESAYGQKKKGWIL